MRKLSNIMLPHLSRKTYNFYAYRCQKQLTIENLSDAGERIAVTISSLYGYASRRKLKKKLEREIETFFLFKQPMNILSCCYENNKQQFWQRSIFINFLLWILIKWLPDPILTSPLCCIKIVSQVRLPWMIGGVQECK